MIRLKRLLHGVLAGVVILALLPDFGCVQPTTVGSELLNDDLQVVGFTDTFRIRATTRTEDSIIVHSSTAGGQIIRHCVGNLDDPYFGKSSSVVSTQVFLNGVGSEVVSPNYVIDSVVVALVYSKSASYGDLDVPVSFSTYKLDEDLDPSRNYYSNEEIARLADPIGSKSGFVPAVSDSVEITLPGDTSLLRPQLRVPMSYTFISELRNQPESTFESQDSLAMWWKGVQFELSEGANTMLGLSLSDGQSGVYIYYRNLDSTVYKQYQLLFFNPSFFDVDQVQYSQFAEDYAGSTVEGYIDNPEATDSLIFVQSLSGVNAELEFIGLDEFDNAIVNQAELEFYAKELPGDDLDLYPVIVRLQTRTLNEDSVLVNSRDVSLALSVQNIDAFGGLSEELDGGVYRYTMNITAEIQDIVQQRAPNRIFLSSYLKQNQPNRLILFGPGHPEYPARLKIAFTRIQ